MKPRKFVSVGAASILLTTIAAAGPVSTAGILTYVGTGIAGDGLYVGINQALSSSCPSPYVYIATSALRYKETVSTVLLASAQGKAITLYYDNAAACTSGGNAVLLAVSIGP
jgi:hypothetical protein